MTFLDAVSKSDLEQFLNECSSVSEIDIDLALQIAISHIQLHDKRQFNAKHLKRITELQKRWKASLKRKQPDFSVYDNTYYVCEPQERLGRVLKPCPKVSNVYISIR
jgi:hypothetical protein